MIEVVTLRDTVNLGSLIVALAVGIGVIVTYFKGVRWKVEADMRQQTIQTLEEGRDAYKARAERLGAEKDELQQKVAEYGGQLALLQQLPRYDDVVRLFGEQMARAEVTASERAQVTVTEIAEQLEHHEIRAQQRHDAQITVLAAIEARLNDGGTK